MNILVRRCLLYLCTLHSLIISTYLHKAYRVKAKELNLSTAARQHAGPPVYDLFKPFLHELYLKVIITLQSSDLKALTNEKIDLIINTSCWARAMYRELIVMGIQVFPHRISNGIVAYRLYFPT